MLCVLCFKIVVYVKYRFKAFLFLRFLTGRWLVGVGSSYFVGGGLVGGWLVGGFKKIPTSLNNLKTKIDDLDVSKLKKCYRIREKIKSCSG